MHSHFSTHHRAKSPSYDEIVSRSRGHAIENYAFQGTKLDISKEMPGRSVFSLSNTDKGISMNYSLNGFSKMFSVSLFGDGSVLGKIIPSDGDGLSFTWMKGLAHRYFEAGLTKSSYLGSFSLKMINPEIKGNISTGLSRERLHGCLQSVSSIALDRSLLRSGSKIPGLFSEVAKNPSRLKIGSYIDSALCRIPDYFNSGIFSASGVLQITPTCHLAGEGVFSISQYIKEKDSLKKDSTETAENSFSCLAKQYTSEVSSTFILSKIFDTWRGVGILHTPGPVGFIVEKVLDESVSLYGEVSMDYRNILAKSKALIESVGCAAGVAITAQNTVTRVSIASNGTATASSDISVGDGATLNLSGQVSLDGPLLGIGFTLAS